MPINHHTLSSADAQGMQAMRAALAQVPPFEIEPASRPIYDELFAQAHAPESVRFEPGEVGGVKGWWCIPPAVNDRAVMLHLHGGGYVLGSAFAYRGFIGQIASHARVKAFIADYALAPERRFPAALSDVRDLHSGLVAQQFERIALCGDSAGGGLALSFLAGKAATPAGIVAVATMSPWIDLSLSGNSMISRATQDLVLSKTAMARAVELYLGQGDLPGHLPVPLEDDLSSMPPVRIDVGNDEILLDDSLRFSAAAERAGVRCETHVWAGMLHVFPLNFAQLEAAAQAIRDVGSFLAGVLRT